MTKKQKAKTQSYVIFPRHIEIIKNQAVSMGNSTASAALRSILDEWQQEQENKKNSLMDAAAIALARQ